MNVHKNNLCNLAILLSNEAIATGVSRLAHVPSGRFFLKQMLGYAGCPIRLDVHQPAGAFQASC